MCWTVYSFKHVLLHFRCLACLKGWYHLWLPWPCRTQYYLECMVMCWPCYLLRRIRSRPYLMSVLLELPQVQLSSGSFVPWNLLKLNYKCKLKVSVIFYNNRFIFCWNCSWQALTTDRNRPMTDDELYTSLSANTIMVKLTNQFQRTGFITSMTWQTLFTWLWRWLPLRLSKRQSLTTVLFRTTFTRTITLYELLILLGSNLLKYNAPSFNLFLRILKQGLLCNFQHSPVQ